MTIGAVMHHVGPRLPAPLLISEFMCAQSLLPDWGDAQE